jgi:hypothetical protein
VIPTYRPDLAHFFFKFELDGLICVQLHGLKRKVWGVLQYMMIFVTALLEILINVSVSIVSIV